MLLAQIVFSFYHIFATLLLEVCNALFPDALSSVSKYLVEG